MGYEDQEQEEEERTKKGKGNLVALMRGSLRVCLLIGRRESRLDHRPRFQLSGPTIVNGDVHI